MNRLIRRSIAIPRAEKEDRTHPPPKKPEEELEVVIWALISKRFSTLTPLKIMSAKFWRELFDEHGMPTRSSFTAQQHFISDMLGEMWRQPLEPTSRKLRMMRDLDVVIDQKKKAWLLENEHVDVRIDRDGYLIDWKFGNGDGEGSENMVPEIPQPQITPSPAKKSKISTWEPLNRTPTDSLKSSQAELIPVAKTPSSAKREPFTPEDDLDAWKYIRRTVYDEDVKKGWNLRLKGCVFWKNYVAKSNSTKTAANWSSHYRKVMGPNLYKMALSVEVKLNLYFFLRLPMSREAQKSLEEEGGVKVKLDSEKFIVKWDWIRK